eukprot:TRINITY_DN3551_c0_g1_i1.p1 TRINITY_DN3551_c0_g1~~TRINITY_DN3551_c0_g1_i1.p1  ORF type:complete len:433 (-),score=81.44 TRINITY_DN3551_c0_g1_i1:246-1544(-)
MLWFSRTSERICSKGICAVNLQTRRVVGVRRLLGGFIRTVHPDLTTTFPEEARRINQRSLAELNSFIDVLECDGVRPLDDGPEVPRELPFFRAHQTRSGKVLAGRVVPLHLNLPSLPALADEPDREFAAARLIRDAQVILESPASEFSEKPDVPPLFTQKGSGRAAFDRLWWQQTQEELVREAIHGPDDEEVRRSVAMRVFASKYGHQLMRRYLSIKSNKRRKRKIASVDAKVEAKIQKKFQLRSTREEFRYQEEQQERRDTVRVLQGGFHPDLVFLAPDVSDDHRREAIRRICGMNLNSDSDFWLLENLWKAMRGTPPPVPLVVAEGEYKAHRKAGFIQVPWNFTVSGLCDLLEEHLHDVREGLIRRRESGTVPPLDQSALPTSPGSLLAIATDSEIFSDEDGYTDSEDEDYDCEEEPAQAERKHVEASRA